MTVISEPIHDIAGANETDPIIFRARAIRSNAAGTGTTTTREHRFYPVAGVLTTTSLDPGPAQVVVGLTAYNIVIPSSGSTIRLQPLIDAGMPTPESDTESFVRNGGGIRRAQRLTEAEYTAIPTPDPETLYIVI